jgi:ATP/ADP translocase
VHLLERYLSPLLSLQRRSEAYRLMAVMGLFFLVVCAVGILKPIKNALALEGLGASNFYKVYLVSAVVVLFVPLFNHLANRFSFRWLIPATAFFFAATLLGFRLLFREGDARLGMLFYGWYDLLTAALVTQFFMAAQLFFNARNAKQAYPLVIAGGSIGAALGGAITGFFAERVGTPNLLVLSAVIILVFGAALPFVWDASGGPEGGAHDAQAGGRLGDAVPQPARAVDRGERAAHGGGEAAGGLPVQRAHAGGLPDARRG